MNAYVVSGQSAGTRQIEAGGVIDRSGFWPLLEARSGDVETGTPSADRVLATVVFTDVVDSTRIVATAGDQHWRQLLDRHDDCIRGLAERHSGRVVKSTGDGALSVFGCPSKAVRFAQGCGDGLCRLGMTARAGVHTGEVEVRGDDIAGLAVHVAARITRTAEGGEVLTSRTVRDLTAGSGLAFTDRGVCRLKGLPDEWQLFVVSSSVTESRCS